MPPELARETQMLAIRGFTMRRRGATTATWSSTRYPPLSVRKLDLSVGNQEPRGALDITFEISGARVRLIATHLGLVPGERRTQVKRIVELVRTAAAGDEAATLLLGDINEWWAFGRPLRWLHRCFEGRAHGDRTFPARWPLFALDRILGAPQAGAAPLSGVSRPRDPGGIGPPAGASRTAAGAGGGRGVRRAGPPAGRREAAQAPGWRVAFALPASRP